MLAPSAFEVIRADRRRQALDRMARLSLLLNMHQLDNDEYPESLEALGEKQGCFIDPFSSDPFVYVRNSTGFRLYSVGDNGKDEDGKNGWADGTNTGDDWLFEVGDSDN